MTEHMKTVWREPEAFWQSVNILGFKGWDVGWWQGNKALSFRAMEDGTASLGGGISNNCGSKYFFNLDVWLIPCELELLLRIGNILHIKGNHKTLIVGIALIYKFSLQDLHNRLILHLDSPVQAIEQGQDLEMGALH